MLSFLTSAPSILYINLDSSNSYHQVVFEQLDFVKYLSDHGKWGMCVGCVCYGLYGLKTQSIL